MTLSVLLKAATALALSFVVVLPPAAVSAQPVAAPAKTQIVEIQNFTFSPAIITAPVGSTVAWHNQDEDPHIVVANDKSFRSPALDTDGRYAFTFSKPGEYPYFCSLHPHMTGKIVIRAR